MYQTEQAIEGLTSLLVAYSCWVFASTFSRVL